MTSLRLSTIFTKRPQPGAVKTRLVPPLSAAEAAEFALAMLDDTVERALASAEFETRLCVAPPGEEAWFRARYPRVAVVEAQHGASLGERLAHDFARLAARHPGTSLCCLGSDAPELEVERIVEAHRAVESGAELVLGPDQGGGYYLVALRKSVPELFTGVEMSTGDTCARTVELASSLGLATVLLAREHDVDVEDDLRRLARPSLLGARADWPARAPRTARAISKLVETGALDQ